MDRVAVGEEWRNVSIGKTPGKDAKTKIFCPHSSSGTSCHLPPGGRYCAPHGDREGAFRVPGGETPPLQWVRRMGAEKGSRGAFLRRRDDRFLLCFARNVKENDRIVQVLCENIWYNDKNLIIKLS